MHTAGSRERPPEHSQQATSSPSPSPSSQDDGYLSVWPRIAHSYHHPIPTFETWGRLLTGSHTCSDTIRSTTAVDALDAQANGDQDRPLPVAGCLSPPPCDPVEREGVRRVWLRGLA